jgi:hypothetical protein
VVRLAHGVTGITPEKTLEFLPDPTRER